MKQDQNWLAEMESRRRDDEPSPGQEMAALMCRTDEVLKRLSPEDGAKLRERPAVAILNKSDLGQSGDEDWVRQQLTHCVTLSAREGTGLAELDTAVREALSLGAVDPSAPMLANERQRGCVRRACSAVEEALDAQRMGMTMDAVNICIDEALEALLELDGRQVTDAVVDEVFANFCVGK